MRILSSAEAMLVCAHLSSMGDGCPHDHLMALEWDLIQRGPARFRNGCSFRPRNRFRLRLPKPMLERLKQLANKRDVLYQSLLKIFVADRLKAELGPD